jgi:hypothetical protein
MIRVKNEIREEQLCLLGVAPLNDKSLYVVVEIKAEDHVVKPIVLSAVHLES